MTEAPARDAVDQITTDLWGAILGSPAARGPRHAAEAALLFAYAAVALQSDEQRRRAEHCRALARTGLARAIRRPDSLAGCTRVGWLVEHTGTVLGAAREPDGSAALDEALTNALSGEGWSGPFDLVRGLALFGTYALERGERGRPCLELVVDRLAAAVTTDGDTHRWDTEPAWLAPPLREAFPAGHLDLGVAHGVAGVLPVLAGAAAGGVRSDVAGRLLGGAARCLLDHESRNERTSAIPCFIGHDGARHPARTAWCYGDVGVAAAFVAAAEGTGRTDLLEAGRRLAEGAVARDPGTFGVVDASLCHGTAGLMHLFDRMHRATWDDVFAGQATHWCGETLRMRGGDQGGGFLYCRTDGRGHAERVRDRSLLEGTVGIGLALLRVVAPHIEPAWERLLGLSVACAT
jgi:hypothetical protein